MLHCKIFAEDNLKIELLMCFDLDFAREINVFDVCMKISCKEIIIQGRQGQ